MGRAKEIKLKVIPSKIANEFVKKYHYSGKVVNSSSLHFGAFLDGRLHGVMSFGCPMDKRKAMPLVIEQDGTQCVWNSMLELNRMAFDDYLPKNSESRCISVAVKLLRKNAPHIKWILSFSDGTQCGDGTIYRASGFLLTGIKVNKTLLLFKGKIIARKTLDNPNYTRKGFGAKQAREQGATPLEGYQLRYIYLIDKTCKITVPIIPFSKIDKIGAGMYKGEKITKEERRK